MSLTAGSSTSQPTSPARTSRATGPGSRSAGLPAPRAPCTSFSPSQESSASYSSARSSTHPVIRPPHSTTWSTTRDWPASASFSKWASSLPKP